MHAHRPLRLVVAATLLLSATGAHAQVFVNNTADIPQGNPFNNSTTENVDFGDVDLDGDWDAVFADGGDDGNDQNRIWINLGGAQAGALGVFADQTSTRFPVISDDSRDIEFGDFDDDGDLDTYTSNTSQLQNQTNRWWINQGLEQGGNLGFYVDETQPRWIDLGATGSSVATSHVLPAGGFIDWSCDCDFGDFDNDGDLDLFHSTYGASFGGTVPSRIFLNDSNGFFREFNPSGFKLSGATIGTGQPALWAQGTFQANTTNTTGAQADIATNTLDIDIGDQDGDLDLDILHGDRDSPTRFFRNRMEENGGLPANLAFRDVTNLVYPASWSDNSGNYEQEMGDVDEDGDLDLYGLNWAAGAGDDRMFRNNSGTFGNMSTMPGSSSDDNEADFLDYDNDGDLDVYVANFSGTSKLYRNDDSGSGTIAMALVSGSGASAATALDADAADVDGDGDSDVFVARDNLASNIYLENVLNNPDNTAPALWRLESVANGAAVAAPEVVRVQVYDNAPYYVTWYDVTTLEVTVDGIRLPDIAMKSSAGQIFRGVIPGNLVGSVSFRARSTDEHDNTGFSTSNAYTRTGTLGTLYGTGSAGSLGVPTIRSLSVPFPSTPLYVATGNSPAAEFVFLGISVQPTGSPIDLSNGLLLNISLPILIVAPLVSNSSGHAVYELFIPAGLSGVTLYSQAFVFDGVSGNQFASTRGLSVTLP